MPSQVINGKSFEWAIAKALSNAVGVEIFQDSASTHAELSFAAASATLRQRQEKASRESIAHLLSKESSKIEEGNAVKIIISSDRAGQSGDVRDVILVGDTEILGISCKNNHRAFKHSRLSPTIDFVEKWGLSSEGVSLRYKQSIEPIFARLAMMKEGSRGMAKWRDLPNKTLDVYAPILSAFENEIRGLASSNNEISARISRGFINYIVGSHDFYKVICRRQSIEFLGFNFHGTLNVHKSKYPKRIHSIERDTQKLGTSILRFQEGHTFSFRLHNASTLIEPSLKFDIQALSLPSDQIYTNHL